MLFHAHRQVAHALLTRPPLIMPRRAITVRLECVMHAASVNPEPGSNSLIIVYFSSFELKHRFQSNLTCSFTLFEFFFQKNLSSSFFVCKTNFLVSSLFNFQGSAPSSLEVSFAIISLPNPFVNTFFNFFQKFFRADSLGSKPHVVYHPSRGLSTVFLHIFPFWAKH